MNPSFVVAFAVGMLLLATGGLGLMCTQWVGLDQELVFPKPVTCHGPEIHVSGNVWRLCCERVSKRQLGERGPIEPLIPETNGARSLQKCTRWMASDMTSRIALAEDACNGSLVSQINGGQMRVCCS